MQNFILKIGSLGYLGAFLSGIFFVFTVAPAAVILFDIANILNPILLLLAGLGTVVGDYYFRYLKDKFFMNWRQFLTRLRILDQEGF